MNALGFRMICVTAALLPDVGSHCSKLERNLYPLVVRVKTWSLGP